MFSFAMKSAVTAGSHHRHVGLRSRGAGMASPVKAPRSSNSDASTNPHDILPARCEQQLEFPEIQNSSCP
jgi:hypothetical protein